jgi:hypothetical protein
VAILRTLLVGQYLEHIHIDAMITSLALTESQAIAVDFFDSGMSYKNYRMLYEGAMSGNAVRDLLINALQAAVGGGLDIAAWGVPVDTIVDIILAVYETGDVLSTISAPATALSVGGKDISAQLKALTLKEGADAILKRARVIIQTLVKTLKTTGVDVKAALNELSKKMQDMVGKASEGVGDWFAALVPDVPGVDILVANAIKALADNSYSIIAKAFDSLPKGIKELFYDPKKMEQLLHAVVDGLIKHFKESKPVDLDKEVEDEKERSILKRAAGAAFEAAVTMVSIQTGGFAVKKATEAFKKVMGPKLAEFLEKQVKPKIPMAVKMMQTIVPLTFAVVAAAQVIMTEFGGEPTQESVQRGNTILREYIRFTNEHASIDGRITHTVRNDRPLRNHRCSPRRNSG